MANAVYPLWKESLMGSGQAGSFTDLVQDNVSGGVYCALVNVTATAYSYISTHTGYTNISQWVVGTDQRISGPTVTIGTFDGSDLTYTAVSGNTVSALVLYRRNTGTNATWKLVLYLDTSQTGLPVVPNGGNITITWSNAPQGIFTLSDYKAKEDVLWLDTIGLASIFLFKYRGSDELTLGLMADDVEMWCPEAVKEIDGLKYVDHGMAFEHCVNWAQ